MPAFCRGGEHVKYGVPAALHKAGRLGGLRVLGLGFRV